MARGTRKTRKQNAKGNDAAAAGDSSAPARKRAAPTSIPELKRSFDALEQEVGPILKLAPAQRVRRFQEVWRRIFGRPVDASAASAYLQVKSRGAAGRGGVTRKAQKGGMAPLDYQTRPGVDGVHGSFPAYIGSGFGFGNTINQEAMFKDCGVQDITPRIAADMGSNKFQAGGGKFGDLMYVIGNKPFETSSPPGLGNDLMTSWSGRQLGQSPDPSQTRLSLF
jgi:hypothetical protein